MLLVKMLMPKIADPINGRAQTDTNLRALSLLLFLPHQSKTWVNEFKRPVLASGLHALVLYPAHRTVLHIPPDPWRH